MAEAIGSTVRRARAPRPARLTGVLGAGVVIAMLAACLFTLPWTLERVPIDGANTATGTAPRRFEAPNLDEALLPPFWARHMPDERARLERSAKRRSREVGAALRRALELREAVFRTFAALVSRLAPAPGDLELLNDSLDHTFGLRFDDARVTRAAEGALEVVAEDGTKLAGTISPISGAEIDITHCFDPPERSVYRRSLVRFAPAAGSTGFGPAMGWLESNRFPRRHG